MLDSGERVGSGACEKAAWRFVAVDRTTNKVVLARIAGIDNEVRHSLGHVHKAVRDRLGRTAALITTTKAAPSSLVVEGMSDSREICCASRCQIKSLAQPSHY